MRIRPLPVAIVGVLAAVIAAWLFPRAFPIVALEQGITRDAALARADSFFQAHELAPAGARTAVRFRRNDSLRTFVELAGGGGGADSLNALVRGRDVAPYTWSVRAFVPGDAREARVDFAPDGRIIGFERKLAEADARPDVGADSARRLADHTLAGWIAPRPGSWTVVSTSYDTKPGSGRVDRTFTFERTDRRIGDGTGAPIRIDAVIAGDLPSGVRPYVEIPESFDRRYAEMRSWNDLLAILASLGVLAIAIAGVVALTRYARTRNVRWRPAMLVGGVIGAFAFAAGLNEMPGSWFGYDTAMSPATFRALQLLLAVALGLMTALMAGFTLAAAEAATRHAFPRHLDWWKLWRHRGTGDVAASVGGGYVVAAIAFAYVALFYLATRTLFGWWVPSELLDDPNQIASPMPWVSGIAISMNAAVWEEALFRALPLSLLSLWVGQRRGRTWWMAGGVIVSALIFGFAHANYPSWPPYSRGVEIFLDAAFWAVLFLAFGLLVTVVAHFVYNAVLFGIFAAQGSAPEYLVTAIIILAALLAPALVVLWRRARQGGWIPAPESARFAAWTPGAAPEPAPVAELRSTGTLSPLARRLALAAVVAGVLMAVGRPPAEPLGPRFTADRDDVHRVADSVLQARDVSPEGWTRLTIVGRDTLPAWRRFLTRHDLEERAQRLNAVHPGTWWIVRYVHTKGTPAERTEEWRVRVWPDGRPLDVRRVIPDSARRDTADAAAMRRIALAALARGGVDTSVLRETDLTETARPARRDVRVTYTDTSVSLPAGAAARAWVDIAGDEPLVARSGIELPEEFLREDRARQTNRTLIAGAGVLLLVALVIVGALLVKKRRAIVVDDGKLGGRALALALTTLIILVVLGHLNSLPSLLYSYNTAQPWSTFLGITAASLVAPLMLALIVFGVWRGMEGLRRRVGIPMLPAQPSSDDRKEMLIAGLGIGGVAYLAGALPGLAGHRKMPPASTTVLDSFVPWVSGVPDLPLSVLAMVVMAGIPLLTVAGLSTRWPLRVAISAVPVAIVAVIMWSLRPEGDVNALRIALSAAGLALGVAGLLAWGARFAWSWIVAALALEALGGLRDAAYGAVWQPRVAGVLVFLFAAALIAMIARRATAGRGGGEPAGVEAGGGEFGGAIRTGSSVVAAIAAMILATPALAQTPVPRPNIVVIVIDDLRWDEFGAAGHPWLKTPNIDRLAREGAFFANSFHAVPLCSPNRATLLTGQYPSQHGIIDNVARNRMSHRLETFPATLQKSGYETAFLGKWHMGNDPTPRPGFDLWAGLPGQGRSTDPELYENGRLAVVKGYTTDILTDRAVAFINKPRTGPFLVYLAHKAVHPDVKQLDDGSVDPSSDVGYVPAPRHLGAYETQVLPRRPSVVKTLGDLGDKPAIRRALAYNATGDVTAIFGNVEAADIDETTIRRRAEMMLAVDEASDGSSRRSRPGDSSTTPSSCSPATTAFSSASMGSPPSAGCHMRNPSGIR